MFDACPFVTELNFSFSRRYTGSKPQFPTHERPPKLKVSVKNFKKFRASVLSPVLVGRGAYGTLSSSVQPTNLPFSMQHEFRNGDVHCYLPGAPACGTKLSVCRLPCDCSVLAGVPRVRVSPHALHRAIVTIPRVIVNRIHPSRLSLNTKKSPAPASDTVPQPRYTHLYHASVTYTRPLMSASWACQLPD